MTINQQNNICLRCHNREKFLEIFKKCLYCSKKFCNQCWIELQISDDYKLLIDILPKVNTKRICSICIKTLLEHTFKKQDENNHIDENYQLAIAMSLSQNEADEKMKEKQKSNKIDIKKENLLEQTADAIEKFMNRAKSNYQRNRDVIGDTALLSAFISLQTCATDLEQLKHNLNDQRQHFETLQEKLTALRDAREALNILRYEHQQNKQKNQEYLEQQRRLLMIQKIAELRQFKHTQIANFQQNYFQHLLDEEQQMTERLKKQKKNYLKEEQFDS